MRRLVVSALLLSTAGCASYRITDLDWKIVLSTPSVSRGGDLIFRVETYNSKNEPVEGYEFKYVIDWHTVKGIRHWGETFHEHHLRCKGNRGPAELRIYGYNENGSLVEVGRTSFVIE